MELATGQRLHDDRRIVTATRCVATTSTAPSVMWRPAIDGWVPDAP